MPTATLKSDFDRAEAIVGRARPMLREQIAKALADERENIAKMVERLDNSEMKQDRIAAIIRRRA